LELAGNSPGGEKVYGTLASIIGVVYIVLVVLWYFDRKSGSDEKDAGDANKAEISGGKVDMVTAQKMG
jgi:hypothetical protein